MGNLRTLLGIILILSVIFFAGMIISRRKSKSKSYQDAYRDYLDNLRELEGRDSGAVLPDAVQKSRALSLNKAFNDKFLGVIPGTDEQAVYDIFAGFVSLSDFARFQAIYDTEYPYQGMNLMTALKDELTDSEYRNLDLLLKRKTGASLL